MTKANKALDELHLLLLPTFGDETEAAAEALIEYVALAADIYREVERDPEKKRLLRTLTDDSSSLTMAAERSFTNQYEKP